MAAFELAENLKNRKKKRKIPSIINMHVNKICERIAELLKSIIHLSKTDMETGAKIKT